jgi:hypothetical protein
MSVTSEPVREPHALATKRDERRAAGVACGMRCTTATPI